ncbi:hypothetical protein H257_09370 [Aphanomyces astaci]|uniref:Uncharacterized protein n=1 Tax=Aphanomyces astaci TaxID=112090 RepID=W4GB99_APHAT|nr:hypothetical protein H257_09370 [Aphanomyces astaci]ETV76962.1 hypothetical protein H257_09370 [Aphanomyces astaci]RHY53104.1 hypothetical protein DYB38_002688 [Aphanomyces astaci]RHY97336.1 hypothetical protein DYB35_006279 [Aphanomyces astaci]RHZ05954.1 hypothetical protein DYB37_006369 [Aphanomyces astaci]RQM28916.1 hypothetical protein B5M09_004786 [Aphanomyces astaci]|eukprot:XP_009833874.1 hypothetical protein H257_09370 [Aphanomyces astaci]
MARRVGVKGHLPWFAQPSWLQDAVVGLVHGYTGQVAARWHVVPRGFMVFGTLWDSIELDSAQDQFDLDMGPVSSFPVRMFREGGVFSHDERRWIRDGICERILQLRATTTSQPDRSFLNSFTYIHYDVVDAASHRFQFAMLYSEGNEEGDASGFYAVVWHRQTHQVVATCSGDGNVGHTFLQWHDAWLTHTYVPHEGRGFMPTMTRNCILRTKKMQRNTGWSLLMEYLNSTDSRRGLYFSHTRHELERLVPVAAKLAHPSKWCLFPQPIPRSLVVDVAAMYLRNLDIWNKKVVSRVPMDVWHEVASYLGELVFWDHTCKSLGQD